MLYTFRSKAAGEILMLGEHARPLLEAAGKLPEVAREPHGVFTVAQLPQAIAGLEASLTRATAAHTTDETGTDLGQAEGAAPAIRLDQRAFPLLDMLRKAQVKGVDVVWLCT